MGATPVPIPNTTVKTHAADGTSLETVRESRWPPESKKKKCPVTAVRPCTHLENRIYESCSNMPLTAMSVVCTRRIGRQFEELSRGNVIKWRPGKTGGRSGETDEVLARKQRRTDS